MTEQPRQVTATVTPPPGGAREVRRRSRSLRSALGWLLGAVLLPLLTAGAAFLANEWKEQRELAIARLQDAARTLQRTVDRELTLDQAVLRTLSEAGAIDSGDWASFHVIAAKAAAVRPESWFVLFDRDRQMIVNTRLPVGAGPLPNFGALHANRPEAEWEGRSIPLAGGLHHVLFEMGKPSFSGLIYSPVLQRPAVGTNLPVIRDGKVIFGLSLVYSSRFYETLLVRESAPGLTTAIFDARGRFIARNRDSEKFVGRPGPPPFSDGLARLAPDAVGEAIDIESRPVVYAYSRSGVTDLVVAVAMPKAAVLAPAWRALWLWLGVLAFAAGIGTFFAVRLWRRVGTPLAALAEQAGSLGRRHVEVPPADVDEIDAVRVALLEAEADATARNEAEKALRESAELLEHGDGLIEMDRSWIIVRVNAAQERVTGKPRSETVGRSFWEIWPEARETRAWREYHRCMEERVPVEFEDYFAPLDRWFAMSAYPTSAGGIAVFFRDVTGRKQADAELRAREEQLRLMFENMSEGILLFDAHGDAVYQNPASLRIHGVTDEEGKFKHDTLPVTWRGWNADGTPLPFDAWPLSRVLRGETFQNQVLRAERVETGHSFDASYNGCPLHDPSGKLRYGFITIRDITEQVRARREEQRAAEALSAANARLVAADRRKDEFLGMLSHELRNPLAPIRSSVYVLHHADPASDKARRARTVIDRQSEHLTRIVDDLLDVTRIARGKILLHRERVDLRELVVRAGDDALHAIQQRGVALRIDVPEGATWADADATRMSQVIGNLLNNAAKFTQPGGEITIALRTKDGAAEIRVRDTGVGIEPELLPTIFEAFVQGKRTLARTEGGIGIGLALVKGVVELHGGTVSVRSGGIGHGAEFVVALPLAAARAQEPAPGDAPRA